MSEKKKRVLITLGHFVFAVLLVVLDQVSKLHIRTYLSGGKDISVIDGVFRIVFVKNTGAVWGLFRGFTEILSYSSVLIFILVLVFYIKIPKDNKKLRPLIGISIFVMSGAIGNLIDRIFLKYVVDFLYFELIDFPVFNIADCYITVSMFLLIILFIFYYKDDDLSFLSRKKKDTVTAEEKGDDGKDS